MRHGAIDDIPSPAHGHIAVQHNHCVGSERSDVDFDGIHRMQHDVLNGGIAGREFRRARLINWQSCAGFAPAPAHPDQSLLDNDQPCEGSCGTACVVKCVSQ